MQLSRHALAAIGDRISASARNPKMISRREQISVLAFDAHFYAPPLPRHDDKHLGAIVRALKRF